MVIFFIGFMKHQEKVDKANAASIIGEDTMTMFTFAPSDTGEKRVFHVMKDIYVDSIIKDLAPKGYYLFSRKVDNLITYNIEKKGTSLGKEVFIDLEGRDKTHIFSILAGCYNSNPQDRAEIKAYATKLAKGAHTYIRDHKNHNLDIYIWQ